MKVSGRPQRVARIPSFAASSVPTGRPTAEPPSTAARSSREPFEVLRCRPRGCSRMAWHLRMRASIAGCPGVIVANAATALEPVPVPDRAIEVASSAAVRWGDGAPHGPQVCGSVLGRFFGRDLDEQLDFVPVGIVQVHPFGIGVAQLEQDDDAGGLELALGGIELLE